MIDFACVSSTTPTWSNDPRWCIPGIAATEAEHAKLAADWASSAPVQDVHLYYPFVVEDRGRLGKSALTVVYIFAVLLALYWRRFKTLPRTHLRAKPLSAPCVSAVALTARSTRRTVSGYHSNIGHTKGGGETSDMTDRVFAEPALDRFLKLKAAFACSKYDTLHRAFVDKTLKVSLMASAKAPTAAAFAKRSPDKQLDPNLKPDPRLKPTPQAKA
eukprot:jgi/Tetstr1/457863/TSEL_004265.t1